MNGLNQTPELLDKTSHEFPVPLLGNGLMSLFSMVCWF